jgi:hypothetical protein
MPLLLDEWQGRRFGQVRFRACLEQKGFWAGVGQSGKRVSGPVWNLKVSGPGQGSYWYRRRCTS